MLQDITSKAKFDQLYKKFYRTNRNFKQILKLGNWRFFFLEDLKYLPEGYIVDGDAQKIRKVQL